MSVEATLATWRLSKKQVTPTEKLFLLSCANRAGESHECWPSIKRLCADTGYDRKTIMKTRQSVIEKGLLVYSGEFKGKSGQIPVMQLTYVDNSVSEFTSTENGTSPKSGTGTSPKSGTGDQSQKWDTESKRKNLKEEPNKHSPNLSSYEEDVCDENKLSNSRQRKENPRALGINPRESKRNNPCERFEEFWNKYPRESRNAKKTCIAKWKRENLDSKADEILSALDMQILNDRKWLAGYTPSSLTYINQERWNDELDTRVRGTTAKQQSTDSFHNTMAKYKKAPTDGYYDEHGNFIANYL